MLDKIFKLEHHKLLLLVNSTAEHSLAEIIEKFKDYLYIEKYLKAENEWLLYKYEIEKGIFFDDLDETDKLSTINEIANSKMYMHFEIEDLLNTIISLKINFLVRPNFTLDKFIFGNELTRIFTELLIKLKYFGFYDYLINGITDTFKDISHDHGSQFLTITDFKNVSKSYDESYISELSPEQFAEVIKPLFELFTENGFDGISPKALKIFLEDKNLFEAAQQIMKFANDKSIEFITENAFIEIMELVLDKGEIQEDDFQLPAQDYFADGADSTSDDFTSEDTIDIEDEIIDVEEQIQDNSSEEEKASAASNIAKQFVDDNFTEDIPELATNIEDIQIDEINIPSDIDDALEMAIEDFEHDAFVPDIDEDNAMSSSNLVLDDLSSEEQIPEKYEEELLGDFVNDIDNIDTDIAIEERMITDVHDSEAIDINDGTDTPEIEEIPIEEEIEPEMIVEETIQDTQESGSDDDFNEDEFDLDAFANSILSGESTTEDVDTSIIVASTVDSTADSSEINSIIDNIKSKINSNPSKTKFTKDASETKAQISSLLSTFKSDDAEKASDDLYATSYSDDILNDLNK